MRANHTTPGEADTDRLQTLYFSLGWAAFMIIPFIGILIAGFEPVGPLVIMLGLVILYVAYTIGLGGVLYALVNKNGKAKSK